MFVCADLCANTVVTSSVKIQPDVAVGAESSSQTRALAPDQLRLLRLRGDEGCCHRFREAATVT